MYLKEKRIRLLKVKNVVFIVAGAFLIMVSVVYMMTILMQYWGDWFTIRTARGTPDSILFFAIGLLLIVCSRVSRMLVNDASFFSRYFEGDLSGYIDFEELAEITGKSPAWVQRRLWLLRWLYMKRFSLVHSGSGAGERVELYSKTVTCTCRSCGGELEKRIYFTGECPYCGSSDLSARVISEEHFLCIYDDPNRKVNDPSYYEGPRLRSRKTLAAIGFGLALFAIAISSLFFMDQVIHYNDKDYLRKIILSGGHLYSTELIHKHMRDNMIFSGTVFLVVLPAVPMLLSRLLGLKRAECFSQYFSKISSPYVDAVSLAKADGGTPERAMRGLVKSIREGYLKGCAPEKHGGPLRIGLAKQIVKDRCPSCASPITGAVDETYVCQYCGNRIMGVIRKH